MDRLRKLFNPEQDYEPLQHSITEADRDEDDLPHQTTSPTFSWVEYSVFLLLGVSMLWAWNAFLAAGPYFQHRFKGNSKILNNFQAAEVSVSTITNLGAMLVLTRMQASASYPKRIVWSLLINVVTFALLAISTSFEAGPGSYFGFLIAVVFTTSFATGLCQNGVFAFVSGFGIPQYTQGIMTGQAIAGVLPCIAQIVSVLSTRAPTPDGPPKDDASPETPPVNSTAALAYFLTATVIAVITLLAFSFLMARHRQPEKTQDTTTPDITEEPTAKKTVSMKLLFGKLFWLASAVFLTFGVTMIFPVFTQRIVSVRPPNEQPPILQPSSFIPLAFLFWNIGDLLGRLSTAVPMLSLVCRPRVVFLLSVLRIGWVGLYRLCNIRGQGAVVQSDTFYLLVVQLLFGLSNGYLGSTCMIGAGEWVDEDEREAAGGFMGLCLVAGLAVGSLASFFATGT